ncbi:hypothetical protein K3495_g7724 [Podosphaera aphanis]|nr:hypothetical protein K3495_g7724 [Podosphaera aphanis]
MNTYTSSLPLFPTISGEKQGPLDVDLVRRRHSRGRSPSSVLRQSLSVVHDEPRAANHRGTIHPSTPRRQLGRATSTKATNGMTMRRRRSSVATTAGCGATREGTRFPSRVATPTPRPCEGVVDYGSAAPNDDAHRGVWIWPEPDAACVDLHLDRCVTLFRASAHDQARVLLSQGDRYLGEKFREADGSG